MQASHRTTAILLAVLSIPFGVAIYQDANADKSEFADYYGGGGFGGLFNSDYDPYQDPAYLDDYYGDDYYDDNLDELLAELEEGIDEEYEPEPESMGADFFNSVFFAGGSAKAPTLSGPLAGATPGNSLSSFELKNPESYDWSWNGIPGYDDAQAEFITSGSTISRVRLDFPDDGSAARLMETQWGTPVRGGDEYTRTRTWFAPDQKLRVQLQTDDYDDASVKVSAYETLEGFVAPRAKLFGFEDKDLFDLSYDEIDTLLDDYGNLTLPPLGAMEADGVELELIIGGDEIVELVTELSLPRKDSDELLKLLKTKMGKPKTESDYDAATYTFSKAGRIVELVIHESSYESTLWHSLSIRRK
jgi:hypothetical protein